MKKYHVQPGDKFNHLTAINLDHVGKHYRSYFLFKCDCGKEKVILGSLVTSGNTKSCGCWGKHIRQTLHKLPDNGGVVNYLILQYKRHARNRGLDYNLDRELFAKLIKQSCHYCGVSPANTVRTKNCRDGYQYNGIDRINPEIGYEKENVVPCCPTCNRAKLAMTKNDFLAWIIRVYEWSIQ